MKFSNYQAFLNSRLLGLLPYTHSGHNSSLGISWWDETSLFEQYILQLQRPTTVTAKPKTSRQKQNTSRQKQKPHGKNKNLTAKAKTSRQKQIPTAKPKLFFVALKYLILPWGILFLPWGFWFCREVFCFCREVFGFAVVFSFLPWGFWFCRDSCGPP